ncbi:hypothetical protein, partial [Aliivibrio fischeri]|uniref:hypothetical protein n=2 Tax=Vibrionaceae TaxID=641 RepID=UPI00166EFEDE
TKKRTHKFWAFLDELVPNHVCNRQRCYPVCGCLDCNTLKSEEVLKLEELQNTYDHGWPVFDWGQFNMPRGIKFTPESQVLNKRPQTYDREKRLNKQEIINVIGAVNEIIKRHRSEIGAFPYIALPISENVDSIYKKAMNGNLGINLHFPVSRVTLRYEDKECGAAYVIC